MTSSSQRPLLKDGPLARDQRPDSSKGNNVLGYRVVAGKATQMEHIFRSGDKLGQLKSILMLKVAHSFNPCDDWRKGMLEVS